jgi:hypothetical protein
VTVGSVQYDHKAYYRGAHQLHLRITGDHRSGRLLGAQLVGHHDAEVAKRIDISAAALFHHMSVDGLNDLDASYTPPFRSPWDAIQPAAQDWVRQTHALSGPLLFFDLAEDWLDAVPASAYRTLPSLGWPNGAGAAVDGHHLAVDHAGGGMASGDHRRDAVLAGPPGRHGRPGCRRR